MKYRAVVFDLDGTLLNTLTDLTHAVNHVLSAHGFPLREEREIRRFLGNGAKQLIADSLPKDTDKETEEICYREYLKWYTAHAALATAPYEGICELLEELHQRGIKTAVVSNKGDVQVKALVQKHFPQIPIAIGEREGIRRKPHPDSVLEALRELQIPPSQAVYVGDSEVDLQTARNANLCAAAVSWGFRDEGDLKELSPDLMLHHPSDLLKGLDF